MKKFYTGIGSRHTPDHILLQMREFAYNAARAGWILRSGAANGADSAFEMGCNDAGGDKEIYIPWRGFNGHTSTLHPPSDGALKIASEIHPAWKVLRRSAKLLVARNMHQVLGASLGVSSHAVICWTVDGCESYQTYGRTTGGTGTAISLASLNQIPVFNLMHEDRLLDATTFLNLPHI